MTTQRKIRHLLASTGEGSAFRYLPQLGQPFDFSQPVLVTEKVDGSTMQAIHGQPHKRYDRFSKGDPRKHGASEEERYELKLCSRDNPAERWYLDAFDAHRQGFEHAAEVAPSLWVYFEALGSKIGARYPGLPPTIRVFDIADGEGFLSFEQAIDLANECSLPIVRYELRAFEDLSDLLRCLQVESSAIIHPLTFEPYSCEGWVLRQGSLVAKIRIGDLKRLAVDGDR